MRAMDWQLLQGLFVNVGQGHLGSGSDSTPSPPGDPRIAGRSVKVKVPDTSAEDGSPVDLGEIVLIRDL